MDLCSLSLAALLLGACGLHTHEGGADAMAPAADAPVDGIPDGRPDATPLARVHWSAPVEISGGLTWAGYETCPSTTADGLELYFAGAGGVRVAKRASAQDLWTTSSLVAELQITGTATECPRVSADGRTLYYSRRYPPNMLIGGGIGVERATRPDRASPWTPVMIDNLGGYVSVTSSELVAATDDSDLGTVNLSTRATKSAAWSIPAPVAEIDTPDAEGAPAIAGDGLELYFSWSDRVSPMHNGQYVQIMVAVRDAIGDAFSAPEFADELNTGIGEAWPYTMWVSPDGHTFLFFSKDPSGLWMATR